MVFEGTGASGSSLKILLARNLAYGI